MDNLEEQEICVLLLVLPLCQRVIWDEPLYLVYSSVRLLWSRDRTVLGVWFLCTKALGLGWVFFFSFFVSFLF